jgi:tyrosine-protein kinase Tec
MAKGEKLIVLDKTEEHWWKARNADGKEGYVPSNYLRKAGMEAEPWFLGSVSKSEASALLRMSGTDGCFLVRESESKPGQYSLSVFFKDGLKHYHIKHNGSKYFVSERHLFDTITELIEYHKHNSGGLVTRLRKPVNDRNQPVAAGLGHDKWELDPKEIRFVRDLGSGNFGLVKEGVYKGTIPVAVKMMKPGTMSEDDFVAEAEVMTKFRHKNLVELYGVCTSVKPIYIVTELMTNGCLLDYLRNHKAGLSGDPKVLHYMSVQVAAGMRFLEDHGFIHRDLAARNCLVGEQHVVKVADFGLARFTLDDEYTASEGTKFPIKWASPEVFSFARFSTKSDVWSFGVLLWEIYSLGTIPYPTMNNAQTVDKVTRGYRMDKPELASETIYEVMKGCWHQDPETRLTFAEVVAKLEENSSGYA